MIAIRRFQSIMPVAQLIRTASLGHGNVVDRHDLLPCFTKACDGLTIRSIALIANNRRMAPKRDRRTYAGKIAGDSASVRRPPPHGDEGYSRATKRWKEARRTDAPRRFFLAHLVNTRLVSRIARHREEGKDEGVRVRCRRGSGGANLGPDGCFPAPSLTSAVASVKVCLGATSIFRPKVDRHELLRRTFPLERRADWRV